MLEELKDELNEEAEELLHELNVELPKEIEEAADMGDLRENSEYDAAADRQQFIQARLDYISRRLSELSELDLENIPEDRIGYGSRVRVRDVEDDTEEEYTLAFGDFMDIEKGEISMESPIGKALLGHDAGDEVTVTTPGGELRYEVLEVTTLHEIAEGEE